MAPTVMLSLGQDEHRGNSDGASCPTGWAGAAVDGHASRRTGWPLAGGWAAAVVGRATTRLRPGPRSSCWTPARWLSWSLTFCRCRRPCWPGTRPGCIPCASPPPWGAGPWHRIAGGWGPAGRRNPGRGRPLPPGPRRGRPVHPASAGRAVTGRPSGPRALPLVLLSAGHRRWPATSAGPQLPTQPVWPVGLASKLAAQVRLAGRPAKG